jgi:hypothetical protein
MEIEDQDYWQEGKETMVLLSTVLRWQAWEYQEVCGLAGV